MVKPCRDQGLNFAMLRVKISVKGVAANTNQADRILINIESLQKELRPVKI